MHAIHFMGSRADTGRFHFEAPFLKTDGGRAQSRRPRQRNDCTIRALVLAAGADYDSTYEVLAAAGRKVSRGFHFRSWAKDAEFNGHRFRWFPCQAVKGQFRTNPVTFSAAHPTGSFILKTAKHVMACVDGVIMDENEPDPARCVYGAWELIPLHTPS